MNWTLRPPRPAELDVCFAILRDGMRDYVVPWFGWDDAEQRQHFDCRVDADLRVVVVNETVVGWMVVRDRPEELRVDQIYLGPGSRGRGLGTSLLEHVLRIAGGRPVRLGVLKNNPAHRLYARLGFRVEGDGGHKWHCVRLPEWTGPLPRGPFAGVDGAQLEELCRQFDLHGRPQRIDGGIANETWRVGDAVLRVGRDTADGYADAHTEAAAVPAMVAAGVRTPELLGLDLTGRVVPAPVTVYRRVVGEPVRGVGAGPEVWRELGRQLAIVHAVAFVPDALDWLDEPALDPIQAHLHRVPELAVEIEEWGSRHPGDPAPRGFLHDDLHDANLLVYEGRLAAVIDWGDAGWGDPALDFVHVPAAGLGAALEGYREAGAHDPDLPNRIAKSKLQLALMELAEGEPGARSAVLAILRS